jgi:hypothetical protein
MERFRPNPSRIEPDLLQAFSHPVRIGIMALFAKDACRSLAAEDLLTALLAEDPGAFGGFKVSQIRYHRARLQDAELLPKK